MGLFSGETIVEVATSVVRVIDDESLPNSIKTGALKGILADGNIADYAMEEMITSIALRAERMYSYGETGYIHGSPSGEFHSSIQGRVAVKAILDAAAGGSVTIDYSHFGPPNKLHIGWSKLIELHGYVPSTNILGALTAEKLTNVYLTNLTVVVPEAMLETFENGALDQWGNSASAGFKGGHYVLSDASKRLVPHTLVQTSATATQVEVKVDYQWIEAFNLEKASFNIPIVGYDGEAGYFQVRYTYAGESHYATYKSGTGTYPTLDNLFEVLEPENGQFFPFGYFRFNKQPVDADHNLAAYQSSKKLMKYIGLDFDAISEGIHESPDIEDVEQAMLIMAVPAVTTHEDERTYLFDFFNRLYYEAPERYQSRKVANIRSMVDDLQGISKNAMVIQDKQFKMALSNDGIYKKTYPGKLGPKGTCTSGVDTEIATMEYQTNFGMGDYVTETRDVPMVYHWYRKQVSEVVYEEVRILNLRTVYHIYGDYTAVGGGSDSILLIPLDRSITKPYTMNIREALYSRSLHYVFNSVVITELAWYQTGIFQVLVIAIGIFITLYTMDPEILMMGIAAQAGTMSILSFVWAVASAYILPYLATSLAIKYFVKAVGTEFAFLVALVSAAFGVIRAFNAGSIAGAPWAQELLSLSNGLSNAIGESVANKINGLKEDFDAFSTSLKDEYSKLDKATDSLLTDSNRLAPFVIFGESPGDFFSRTIHSGNIGVRGIEAIGSYVDIALTLPSFSDSLGEKYV